MVYDSRCLQTQGSGSWQIFQKAPGRIRTERSREEPKNAYSLTVPENDQKANIVNYPAPPLGDAGRSRGRQTP
jgi:hypothetical protein